MVKDPIVEQVYTVPRQIEQQYPDTGSYCEHRQEHHKAKPQRLARPRGWVR